MNDTPNNPSMQVINSILGRVKEKKTKTAVRLRAEGAINALDVAGPRVLELTDALQKANKQAEHFERLWYLRSDELEEMQREMEHWKKEAESYKPAWDAMKLENSELRAELKEVSRYLPGRTIEL